MALGAYELRLKLGRKKRECTWCGGPVPKGRRRWCSAECIHEFRIRYDWQYIRQAVYDRDGGVCCLCGCDTEGARKWWGRIDRCSARHSLRDMDIVDAMTSCGWGRYYRRDWWEADHIHARADGGRDHPDNLRTLCLPCHKARTAAWRRRRARGRRAGQLPLFAEDCRC